MLELLSPAGSMESVRAAVQNGADAIYMGYGDFNARRNAKNFTREEFAQAVEDLYGDPNRCRLISGATQVYMREHFSLDAVWNCVKDDFKR